MIPDGTFDAALFLQTINCFVVNQGPDPLDNVKVYLDGARDGEILVEPRLPVCDRRPDQ